MNFEQMAYILEIIKTKSISKAATSLNLSQPYLSTVVKSLEEELQFKIFERSYRGVTLTADGTTFAEYCEKILHYMAKINDMKSETKTVDEAFSVVTNFSYTLLNLFYQFTVSLNINPKLLKFEETQNNTIPLLISSGKFDLGIIHLESSNENESIDFLCQNGLMFTELYREPLYAVVSKMHPLYHNDQVLLRDLIKFPFLIEKFKQSLDGYLNTSSTLFNLFKSFDVEAYNFENNRSLFFYLNKSDTHFTVGQYSHNISNPFVMSGDLKYIPITDLEEKLITGFITQINQKHNPSLDAFIVFLKEHYPNKTADSNSA